ncbi:hypothetical protein [Canibacter zhoujuaniae]|uniref:hypothetical protein n=1 Tax=Canibacter zhoujuaniae TaxID=2708343 RepID=UPI001420948D|nr:hypothetical protein [Canibacter zhoujuaniae]
MKKRTVGSFLGFAGVSCLVLVVFIVPMLPGAQSFAAGFAITAFQSLVLLLLGILTLLAYFGGVFIAAKKKEGCI